jgi:inorganic pyrophosphatase
VRRHCTAGDWEGPVRWATVATVVAPSADAADDAEVIVIVEIPTGSRNKYEFDPEMGRMVLDRMLFTATRYPADYGFIDGTLGEDGDPLDALVFVGEPTFPGCAIRVRPVGLFKMRDEKGSDEKILCVPLRDPAWSHVEELEDLLPTLRAEIGHFFAVYKDLEDKKVDVEGFAGREDALNVIEEARKRARTG